jgi:hypothetical protein
MVRIYIPYLGGSAIIILNKPVIVKIRKETIFTMP